MPLHFAGKLLKNRRGPSAGEKGRTKEAGPKFANVERSAEAAAPAAASVIVPIVIIGLATTSFLLRATKSESFGAVPPDEAKRRLCLPPAFGGSMIMKRAPIPPRAGLASQ